MMVVVVGSSSSNAIVGVLNILIITALPIIILKLTTFSQSVEAASFFSSFSYNYSPFYA